MKKRNELKLIPSSKLEILDSNPNTMPDTMLEHLKKTIRERGFMQPVTVCPLKGSPGRYIVIDGAHRVIAMEGIGKKTIPCYVVPERSRREVEIDLINLNKIKGEFSHKKYAQLLKSLQADLDNAELKALIDIEESELEGYAALLRRAEFDEVGGGAIGSLARDYIVPPFSILDTRRGTWQNRKRDWFSLLNVKELGKSREGGLKFSKTTSLLRNTQYSQSSGALGKPALVASRSSRPEKVAPNVSIFDPVLAEILMLWFCPQGGVVFDPFAGDVSQSIVAAVKGFYFKGIELRQEQIDVHLAIAERLKTMDKVQFFCDDAINLEKYIKPASIDFLFTCPPYYGLEKYSDLPEDLSTMSEGSYDKAYRDIIYKAAATLKEDRFACFVVSEVRRKRGIGAYRGLVPKTIKLCEQAGLEYYNELILINTVGNLQLRVRKIWEASRKIGRTHQNVLVFYKGKMERFNELKARLLKQDLKEVAEE